jgi:NAD(P)-dependent dehydrogenase (short-subunit alcohol dehydrogenase family)
LALEFAPANIRVLAVAPTIIDTPGVRDQMAPLREAGVDVEARVGANPLGRMGVPDDVARVVLFCCTDLAAFMTGSTLLVDAGTLA